eukprot:5572599-Amphidinium_carterae.2
MAEPVELFLDAVPQWSILQDKVNTCTLSRKSQDLESSSTSPKVLSNPFCADYELQCWHPLCQASWTKSHLPPRSGWEAGLPLLYMPVPTWLRTPPLCIAPLQYDNQARAKSGPKALPAQVKEQSES